MEALNVLEEKVQAFIEKHKKNCSLIQELREEVAQLKDDKHKLEHKLEQVEHQLLVQYQNSEEQDEERNQEKQVVDSLIHHIDTAMQEDTHHE